MPTTPRFIRFRDAPDYLGMDKNRFNAEVRPGLVEIPIGDRGIAFDRLDLDAWADDYKVRNGRPSLKSKESAVSAQGSSTSHQKLLVDGTKPKPSSGKSKTRSEQKVEDLLNIISAMKLKASS